MACKTNECVICGEQGAILNVINGPRVALCRQHRAGVLVCGPNAIQLEDGSLYKRDIDGQFRLHGDEPEKRMID